MSLPHHFELLLRLIIGATLGGIIGIERELHGRPAGFRTNLIVGLGATLFMEVSISFAYLQSYPHGVPFEVDSSRIASAVVSGIGFLGAGAILRTGVSIQGLTTAAVLWVDAAVGLAIGSGLYIEGVVATAGTLLALVVLRRLERKGTSERILVSFDVSADRLEQVQKDLRAVVRRVTPTEMQKRHDTVHVSFELESDRSASVGRIGALLLAMEGLEDIRITQVPS